MANVTRKSDLFLAEHCMPYAWHAVIIRNGALMVAFQVRGGRRGTRELDCPADAASEVLGMGDKNISHPALKGVVGLAAMANAIEGLMS